MDFVVELVYFVDSVEMVLMVGLVVVVDGGMVDDTVVFEMEVVSVLVFEVEVAYVVVIGM